MTARLIGIGSPFGADRLGWQAADRLAPLLPPGVETLTLDRPGPALLTYLEGLDRACLIDAARGDRPPGHLYHLQPEKLSTATASPSTHALGLAEALALGGQLRLLPPRLLVLAVETGRETDPNTPLAQAWPALHAAVTEFFRRPQKRGPAGPPV